MKRVSSERGVEVYETKDGVQIVSIRYQSGGKQYTEKVGPSERVRGRDVTRAKARRVLDQRRRAIAEARSRGEVWRSPREQARIEREEAKQAQDQRKHLVFETASKQYLAEQAQFYSRPQERRAYFKTLALAFGGRHLDEVSTLDVRQYYEHRTNNTGPFADWKRKVGRRAAETEIGALSALYEWLSEMRAEVTNPCVGYRPRSRVKSRAYRPEHEPIVPTAEEREALFAAAPSDLHRAAWMLAYYTGARPESELCQLRNGDVVFSGDPRARFSGLGWVTFRETKVGGADRSVPLHPEAEAALRAIVADQPQDDEGQHEWAARPVFVKRGNGYRPWDRYSYRKGWKATLATASVAYPRLRDMWVRDFRKASISDMRAAGTDAAIASRVAGHSTQMNYHYTQATDRAAQDAILRLGGTGAVDRNRGPRPVLASGTKPLEPVSRLCSTTSPSSGG